MKTNSILLFSALVPTLATQAADRPNIVLIMADDMGVNDISSFGDGKIKTPNIDMMVSQGVKFTDYHTNGSSSSPTRAALMTGRYQQRCGITEVLNAATMRDEGLALEEFTIAEAFKQMGYTTALYGKWHLGYDPRFNPIEQGFDYFEGYISGNVDYHSHVDQSGHPDWWNGKKLFVEEGYTTDLISQKAARFVKEHSKDDEPFFLYVPHEASHAPMQGRQSMAMRHAEGAAKGLVTKENAVKKSHVDTYKELVEVMDEGIGLVLQALKDNNLDQNTIVIFCTDNGSPREESNVPYRGRKGTFWEGGHRVPAAMWAPGYKISPKVPYVYDQTVLSMDLFPSLVAFAGGKAPSNLDGVNIMPALKKGKDLKERALFWKDNKYVAVRDGEWKLVFEDGSTPPALYNLTNDESETKNVAAQHADLVESMTKKLRVWEADVE